MPAEDHPRRSHQRGPAEPYNGQYVLVRTESSRLLKSTFVAGMELSEKRESEQKEEEEETKVFNVNSYDSEKYNLNHQASSL